MSFGNVEVKGLSRVEAVENLFVSGTITTSGSMQLGQTLVDGDSDLILSSSATSNIVVSGNLNVLGTLSNNGSPVGAGGAASILSSSTGIIASSGTIAFSQDSNLHVISTNSNLILSASGATQVSGNLRVTKDLRTLGEVHGNNVRAVTGFYISGSNAFELISNKLGVYNGWSLNWSDNTSFGAGYNTFLSRVSAGLVGVGDSLSLGRNSAVGSRSYVTNANGHLILSSSHNGSVVAVSGVAKFGQYTQASLPTGDTYSGSMVWVTDKKCFAIYGPEGWQRLSSGTL